jgi:short subunit dehydrogenase-like uncharacterized protein
MRRRIAPAWCCVQASDALKLKLELPDATHLTLGFDSRSGLSKGTAKTAIESVGEGCKVRKDGKIISVPLAAQTRRIDFGNGERLAVRIPWGDVSTAYYTTGIGNIEVYSSTSEQALKRMRRAERMRPLLRQRWVRSLMQFAVDSRVKPPDQAQRDNNPTFVWGEARNAAGQVVTARQRTTNGYTLTVSSALGILSVLLGVEKASGYLTPSMIVGPDYVGTLPGCSPIRVERAAQAA